MTQVPINSTPMSEEVNPFVLGKIIQIPSGLIVVPYSYQAGNGVQAVVVGHSADIHYALRGTYPVGENLWLSTEREVVVGLVLSIQGEGVSK